MAEERQSTRDKRMSGGGNGVTGREDGLVDANGPVVDNGIIEKRVGFDSIGGVRQQGTGRAAAVCRLGRSG